ncbi:MAG: antibiotic biosynthesis monooxygenase [Alphaproteobacteria bacterium]|nr:MAG: antibiotic biosynthesis monooxygenase [Alphaproteobacteria bacterium]
MNKNNLRWGEIIMAEGIVYSVGFWTVKTGKEEAFLKTWTDFANWTLHNQTGSLNVVMLQDSEQKNRFISFGPWENLDSLQAWRQRPEFKAAFLKFKKLCDEIKLNTMKSVINISSEFIQK